MSVEVSSEAAAPGSVRNQHDSAIAAVELSSGDKAHGSATEAVEEGSDVAATEVAPPRKRSRGGEDKQVSPASEDGPSAETRRKYDEVLEELKKNPRYLRAQERNNALAEERRKHVNAWMKVRSQQQGQGQAGTADQQAEKEKRRKYDEVLGELQGNAKFLRAKDRLGGGSTSDGDKSSSTKETKPHNFS